MRCATRSDNPFAVAFRSTWKSIETDWPSAIFHTAPNESVWHLAALAWSLIEFYHCERQELVITYSVRSQSGSMKIFSSVIRFIEMFIIFAAYMQYKLTFVTWMCTLYIKYIDIELENNKLDKYFIYELFLILQCFYFYHTFISCIFYSINREIILYKCVSFNIFK